MKTEAEGNRNERRTIAGPEAAGYRCCRSAASLGEWDVIGVGSADVVLLHVESNDWPGTVEVQIPREFRAPAGVRKLVHCRRDRQRLPYARGL